MYEIKLNISELKISVAVLFDHYTQKRGIETFVRGYFKFTNKKRPFQKPPNSSFQLDWESPSALRGILEGFPIGVENDG